MDDVLERFLRYVSYDTQSKEDSGCSPSTPGQLILANVLADEMRSMGVSRVRVSKYGYVYGELPATPGMEHVPPVGFLSHMDTSDGASGKNVRPQIVKDYDGGPIVLGRSGRVIDPIPAKKGETLITTDGTTLLGGDDKAGIAEIMSAAAEILQKELPHGKVCICFTPDEEIGRGVAHFEPAEFGAVFCYTMDGGEANSISYQNFNAATASFTFNGKRSHPGSAKGSMINAVRVAMELDSMLPAHQVPEETEDLEGFFHLTFLNGDVGSAKSCYLIRDHDKASFENRKTILRNLTESLNRKYGANTVALSIREEYSNMAQLIERHFWLVETAERAIRDAGLTPDVQPIRGGTDGAHLAEMGLPCPNLGVGGYLFHGEYEYVSLQEMLAARRVILNIVWQFQTSGKGIKKSRLKSEPGRFR